MGWQPAHNRPSLSNWQPEKCIQARPLLGKTKECFNLSTMVENIAPVLQVNQLRTRFKTRTGDVHAVNTVSFDLRPGVNSEQVRDLLVRRKETQPIGEWSCGSVFTNPPGDHAARLIEASGLKGYRLGGASVSDKHANFIINHGAATAADLEQLIAHVQQTVLQRQGVQLSTEVRVIGEPVPPARAGDPS